MAPNALISPSRIFEDWMRIFRPLKSSSFLSGLLALNSLKPLNQYASPTIPFGSSSLNRSEEHTSELQSLTNLVCRLLLEKKKTNRSNEARVMKELGYAVQVASAR